MRKAFFIIGLLFCPLVFIHSTVLSAGKDTVIIITKPASPERLAQIKARQDSLDIIASLRKQDSVESSRFVKRKKDKAEGGFIAKTIFKVNRDIYGNHTEFISSYVSNYHENFGTRLTRILKNNRAYFKLIDNVMRRFNVPREMKSLAVIESAMNCNAVSPVGAVGPWQFMEGTAKMLGLRVDQGMDERRDFYKSTNAAARYLKKLHGMFHDWLLVIASYNCGPAPVLRAINTGQGRSFWDIKPKLPKETQNHVMAFIATSVFFDKTTPVLTMGAAPKGAKVIASKTKLKASSDIEGDEDSGTEVVEEDKSKPQFTPEELASMAIIKVKGRYTIAVISKFLDEDPAKLRKWNPTFDQDIVSSSSSTLLRLPIDKIEAFIMDKEKINFESAKTR